MARKRYVPKPRKVSEYDLLKDTIELEGTTFLEHLRSELYNPRDKKGSEGPGERIYRRTYGLDETLVGSPKGRDIPEENNKELKSIFTLQRRKPTKAFPEGRLVPALTHFRAGQYASDVCNRAIASVGMELVKQRFSRLSDAFTTADKHNDPDIDWNVLLNLITGGLSQKQRALLPRWANDMILASIKPSVSLADCTGGIGICIPEGHFDVPVADYDDAFYVSSVSKGLVSYRLSRNYVEKRRQLALARSIKPIPDCVPVEPLGQVADEGKSVSIAEIFAHLGTADVHGL